MIRAILVWCMLLAGLTGSGQTLDSLYRIVEQQHPALISQRHWLESEKARSRTGRYPDNPEISYLYLFGNPENIGDQQELEVMQSFRLPGYYASKADLKDMEFEQNVLMAEQEKRKIFYGVSETYLNLVWLTKQQDLLDLRRKNAEKLVRMMEEAFEQKAISRGSYEKARIQELNILGQWRKTVTEIEIQRSRLAQMTGGMVSDHLIPEYPGHWRLIAEDSLLALLISRNPGLDMARLNIRINEERIRFEKWNRWPELRAGYKSETILDQQLQGVHAGISIPLWQNRNRVRQVQLQHDWYLARFRQQESKVLTTFRSLYNEVETKHENYLSMREVVSGAEVLENSLQLLTAGQISFPEYLVEIGFFTEAMESLMLAEKEYYMGLARIRQITAND